MSKEENIPKPADASQDDWADADAGLGQALVLLNRLLSRLDDTDRAVQMKDD